MPSIDKNLVVNRFTKLACSTEMQIHRQNKICHWPSRLHRRESYPKRERGTNYGPSKLMVEGVDLQLPPQKMHFFTIFWLLIYFFALARIYVPEQKNSVSRHGFPIKATAAELSKMNFASVGSFPTHNVEKLSKHLQNKFGPTTFCMSVIVFSRAMLQSGTKWFVLKMYVLPFYL